MPPKNAGIYVIVMLKLAFCYSGTSGQEHFSCGPRTVAIAKRLLDRQPIEKESIINAFDGNVSGDHSLQDLNRALEKLGLQSRFIRLHPDDPGFSTEPTIITISLPESPAHFVIVYGRDLQAAQVIDYPHSPRFIPLEELSEIWNGEGLEISSQSSGIDVPFFAQLAFLVASGTLLAFSLVPRFARWRGKRVIS